MPNMDLSFLLEGRTLIRLLEGLWITGSIAFISVLISVILGIFIGLSRLSANRVITLLNVVYLELIRIIPILVWLFIFYFSFTTSLGLNLSGYSVSILVFTLWGTAEMGDIVRTGLISLPKHQSESAKALGLNQIQVYRYILMPQALKRILPSAINLSTRMIKTTSLVVLIGVTDLTKIGQQIIENARFDYPLASFWVYGLIFFIYFSICYPLSILSRKLEQKWG